MFYCYSVYRFSQAVILFSNSLITDLVYNLLLLLPNLCWNGLLYMDDNDYLQWMTGLPAHQKIGMPSLSPTMTEACALLKAMMIQTMLDLLLYA